jgi:hypothetical protein
MRRSVVPRGRGDPSSQDVVAAGPPAASSNAIPVVTGSPTVQDGACKSLRRLLLNGRFGAGHRGAAHIARL